MAGLRAMTLDLDEWLVRFSPRTSTLDCRLTASGARVRGKIEFWVVRQGKAERWRVGPPVDEVRRRLALIDPLGECQGYLAVEASGGRLTLTATERVRQNYAGRLVWRATATLGKRTFACRTVAPTGPTDVVQMASGPADSALNDSIFDIDRDVALRFLAEERQVTSNPCADGERPTFAVRLQARPEDAAASSLTLEVVRDYYRSRYVPWYTPLDKKRCPEAPTGWMSWNVYFDQAGEKENLAEARIGARYLRPYGMKIWSIESWQDNSGRQPVRGFHNLTLRPFAEQFPHGMKWLAERIRRLGFSPGIWSVPFGTGSDAFYRQHVQWFLHDAEGKPLSNWCGLYLLDPSQPAVRRFMRETHRVMSREWGYEFFKIDGMSNIASSYSCHYYEKPEVRDAFRQECANPYELCVKALRRGIGPDRIVLACGGAYTAPDAAVCDAARIGHDVVGIRKPPKWRNYMRQVTTTLVNLFTNNIVWYTDPDTLLFGRFAPLATCRVAATVTALPGQLTFSGDKLGQLPPERMWLLQRCLPVADVRPLDLYPIHELRRVWALKVRRPFGAWDVVSVFNFEDTAKDVGFRMADIGLDPKAEYHVFDFWRGRYLGKFRRRLSLRLKRRSNALLALRQDFGRPQFLSTDRHLTQGAVSLKDIRWDEKELTLSGTTELVAGDPTTLTFCAPQGYRLARARVAGSKRPSTKQRNDGTIALTLASARSRDLAWRLTFTRQASPS